MKTDLMERERHSSGAQEGLLDFIRREDPDILCLQETKAQGAEPNLFFIIRPRSIRATGRQQKKGYSGTVTYTKEEPKRWSGHRLKIDTEGRFVITNGELVLYNAISRTAPPAWNGTRTSRNF